MKKVLLLMLILLMAAPTVGAETVPVLEYYVTDLAGVLSYSDVYDIEDLCVQVENATTAEIAVLVVNTTYPLSVEGFAVSAFEVSGIGKEGKDNGVLVLIAVNDSSWRIEVGYGLEGILNDAKVGEIGRTYLVPDLQEGYYGNALYFTVLEIGNEIIDNYDGSGMDYPIPGIPLTWTQLIIAAVVFIIVLVITKGRILLWIGDFFRRFGGGRSGGGGASGRY